MGADMRSVHPDIGVIEHGAEAQEHPIADPILRQLEGAAVDPDPGSAAQIVELRLPCPGDFDAARLRDGLSAEFPLGRLTRRLRGNPAYSRRAHAQHGPEMSVCSHLPLRRTRGVGSTVIRRYT
jgi:hypothetical protein